MEGVAVKTKGRRRAKKADAAAAAAAGAGAAVARPAATDATVEGTELTEPEEAIHPRPSLSQRVVKSLKQLSQLGATSKSEEAGEVEQQRGEAQEPAAAGGSREGEGEWQKGLGGSGDSAEEAAEDGEEEEEEEEGRRGWKTVGRLGRLLRSAEAVGRRLSSALHDGASRLPTAGSVSWPSAATLLLLALTLTGALLAARQARANSRQLAALHQQVHSQLEAAGAARARLARQLAEAQRSLEALGARQLAAASTLEALQEAQHGTAGTAAELGAELAKARSEIAQLQRATAEAAAAAGAAATAAPAGGTAGAVPAPGRPASSGGERGREAERGSEAEREERMRRIAREEAGAELDLFAADRTGQPDWALAAGGAAVVAHSPVHAPPPLPSRLGALRSRLAQGGGGSGASEGGAGGVHPQANKLLLGPAPQPGACLPLLGSTGWVDVRLARPIHATAFTYEHIPPAIAYDIRSAPRNLTLLGFLGKPPLPPTAAPASAASEGAARSTGSAVQIATSASGSGGGSGAGSQTSGSSSSRPAIPQGSFTYDAHARRAVQTFPVAGTGASMGAQQSASAHSGERTGAAGTAGASQQGQAPPPAQGPLIDHIRVVVTSNHGHPDYTCLYRLRMHGTPLLQPY